MTHSIDSLFSDEKLVAKIQRRLPNLFQISDLACTRNGKIGQEVGATREKILIALLIYHFGDKVLNTVDPTKYDVDVRVENVPISIKTITVKTVNVSGIKIVWTADNQKAAYFHDTFYPTTDLLLAVIRWGHDGGLYYIRHEQQEDIFKSMGRDNYLRMLRAGTNNRGVEYSSAAIGQLIRTAYAQIPITWKREDLKYNPFEQWIEYWKLN